MNISVIGAGGFLATGLRKYLDGSVNAVQAFSKNPVAAFAKETFVEADITGSFPYEKLLHEDLIFYCAGKGVQSGIAYDKEELFFVNTYFPIKLAGYLTENNFKGVLVTFGSYFEIGNNSSDKKFTEKDIVFSMHEVPNDYCVSKRLFTKYIYDGKMGVRYLHFILPTIYGENENSNRLIPYIVNAIKNKQPLSFTSGSQVRQYLYVNDLIEIFFAVNSGLTSGIYNMPSKETLTVKELAYSIANYFNYRLGETEFSQIARADISMQNLQLDASSIKRKIPGFHYTPIEEVLIRY